MVELLSYSEALFNTLEYLDKNPSTTGEGVTLDNAKAGISSYYIDQAYEEGYIEHRPSGSAKYFVTVEGLVLLNQLRLKKVIEKANKSATIAYWINGTLAVVIALATIWSTIKFG